MTRPPVQPFTVEALAGQLHALAARSGRILVGIAGSPGAGKSTVSEGLMRELGDAAALVPMDGFHLSNRILERLGRRDRKGAPDTFDAAGYVALLRRLRTPDADVVYAPTFAREIEEPINAAIAVPSSVPIVVTEGNYLLLNEQPWDQVRPLLDAAWYVDVDDTTRIDRLIARHIAFGKTPAAALTWATSTDQRNADLVAASAYRADLVLQLPSDPILLSDGGWPSCQC